MIIKYCLTCIFLCAIFLTKAQDGVTTQADSLLKTGDYFGASIEYERVLFVGTADWKTVYACITGKLNCLKKLEKFKEAVAFVGDYLNTSLPDTIVCKLLYEQALCSYLAKNYENTVSLSTQIENSYPAFNGIPVLNMLKIFSLNELNKWAEAKSEYTRLILKYNTEGASPPTDLYATLPKLKSEKKAQWLSTLIPGGGQLYAGKPLESLASIMIQGAGVYYAIISWNSGYYISAWLGVGIFGSFHNGGVRRAEALVQQYNASKIKEFNYSVQKQLLQIMSR